MNRNRCLLPLRTRPPLPRPLTTQTRHRLLPKSHVRAEPISKSAPYIVLGDGDCESGALGVGREFGLLEEFAEGVDGAFIFRPVCLAWVEREDVALADDGAALGLLFLDFL